jgi:DNA-binding XRE family transcriptional regulator
VGYRMLQKIVGRRKLDPHQRQALLTSARASVLVESLAELRRHRKVTQVELAELLERAQPTISALENAEDNYLSTVEAVVDALGGRLELVAVFRNERIAMSLL